MTPLAQLVDALLDATDPLCTVLDSGRLSTNTDEDRTIVAELLSPLESLYAPHDLLAAAAVLETVAPMIAETHVLLSLDPAERLV
jgi:hypothetical protein